MKQYPLHKQDILRRRSYLKDLFAQGKALNQGFLRLIYLADADLAAWHYPVRVQAVFAVPKRYQKSAVKRNRIKRLLRDAYRHALPELKAWAAQRARPVLLCWVYSSPQLATQAEVDDAVIQALQRLQKRLEAPPASTPPPATTQP